jgi:ATP-dependent exoDNAse (exonuclease V) alpha subunit
VPVEFLNSLNASGLPVANLELKQGCPIILLRNLDNKHGLCNGTRATVTYMSNRVLQVCLLGGDHDGDIAFIPRITLSPSICGIQFTIHLKRRQFPVQLAFAMTINQSQGQSVQHVGINLRTPPFGHGQLYVAFSRVTASSNIKVLLPSDTLTQTTNVVYPEILLH